MRSFNREGASGFRSPYQRIICPCGCDQSFRPNRSNQIYLNKRHADKAYYQNVKRPQQANQNFIEQKLRKNDNILAKYYNYYEGEIVICNLDPLMADGFDLSYFNGEKLIREEKFHLTYNYMVRFYLENDIDKAKIRKNDKA